MKKQIKRKIRSKKKIRHKNAYALVYDLVIISVGIAVAVVLVKMGFLDFVTNYLKDYKMLSSFIAGLFFTSAFTVAPASLVLINLADSVSIQDIALWGAIGALCGDLILFYFIRDRFSGHLMGTLKTRKIRHFINSFHFGFLKWIAPLVGGLLIAIPLPTDEFGIALMGVSKTRVLVLMPMIFVMNATGIYFLIKFASLL